MVLLKIERPSSTAETMVAKLSSARTMSEASLATAVPDPMAIPISAFFRAGASLTPSPVWGRNRGKKKKKKRKEKKRKEKVRYHGADFSLALKEPDQFHLVGRKGAGKETGSFHSIGFLGFGQGVVLE